MVPTNDNHFFILGDIESMIPADEPMRRLRIFVQPESRHGGTSFLMLQGDPKNFKMLSGQWHPPHPHTSVYANQPLSYPLVDGRLFVRGSDAVYCYDQRKEKHQQEEK